MNKILSSIKKYNMVKEGDTVICAVSGGADSMFLLWNMHLLASKLNITVEAAHFNHNLRGEESDRDEQFVRDFCRSNNIKLYVGSAKVVAGDKGLEAAARDARYKFFDSLNGIIATAHTADDNAETIIMHLIRGTGLHGLGGIAPVRDNIIRPMLDVTRAEIESYLFDNDIAHIEDSSNHTDDFFRNRVRHNIIPLMKQENPRLAETISSTAQSLRYDDDILDKYADQYVNSCKRGNVDNIYVSELRRMNKPIRIRIIRKILEHNGLVVDVTSKHIDQINAVIMSSNPSAKANIINGYTVRRNYDQIVVDVNNTQTKIEDEIIIPGITHSIKTANNLTITIRLDKVDSEKDLCNSSDLLVDVSGPVHVRSRMTGDTFVLSNGHSKSLKKLFIDRKIPAHLRNSIPVLYDDKGIICVYHMGVNNTRKRGSNLYRITFGIKGE